MRFRLVLCGALAFAALDARAATLRAYFAHTAKADEYGVIAPWYTRQNGQFDHRVRIAAETLKRYPWATGEGFAPAPHYVYNGRWQIDDEGTITPGQERDFNNGDLAQRAHFVIGALLEYYRYSGDPAVFTPLAATIDYLIDSCQTSDTYGWPRLLISVPTAGALYGPCRLGPEEGWIIGTSVEYEKLVSPGLLQLDIVAEVGHDLVRAYQLTGNERWLATAKHWADLLAQNRNRTPGAAPWGRFAKKTGNGMYGVQTGAVGYIISFFDELIRVGYRGANGEIVAARDAGRQYLDRELLPNWSQNDTWGREFWDWEAPVQDLFGTEASVGYILDNKEWSPNWRNDVRNVLGIFLNHSGVAPESGSNVYHGAWSYPESNSCCERSLWYSPVQLGELFARYGVEADSEWARELTRRSLLLATYDPLPTGQTNDVVDGGSWINSEWFKIAHPMALKNLLRTMGWMPELMGPSRENHIMRSSSVVRNVVYGKGRVQYATFDAPAPTIDVLRLAFRPTSVAAGGVSLASGKTLDANGYTEKELENGDYIVTIRHDGQSEVVVTGDDPQQAVDDSGATLAGSWAAQSNAQDHGGSVQVASAAGASATLEFEGNQVRLIGRSGPSGGMADIYLDDVKQLVGIDFHSPMPRFQQVMYYRSGLTNGRHSLRIVARGAGNPLSRGTELYVDAWQSSNATGDTGYGSGGGEKGPQRMIFGYDKRHDYVDTAGNAWRPGTEFIARARTLDDSVVNSWWTRRRAAFIAGTQDEELYRYGAHWSDFTVHVTVGPGKYYARLKLAETEFDGPNQRAMSIYVNGEKKVAALDVYATAGGAKKAVDIVFNGIEPKNGMVDIRFVGDQLYGSRSEAMVQAIEVGQGETREGAELRTTVASRAYEASVPPAPEKKK
jgi:hypothetical protein